MQKRFKSLAERLGCKIVPVATRVNNRLTRRPDIMGVEKHGEFVMVIPKRIYGFPNASHVDLGGRKHPDFFECERILYKKLYE